MYFSKKEVNSSIFSSLNPMLMNTIRISAWVNEYITEGWDQAKTLHIYF